MIDAPSPTRSYEVTGLGPHFELYLPFLFLAAIPFALYQVVRSPGDAWFLAIWSVLAVSGVYRSLFHLAYRIDVDGDAVTFKSLLPRRLTTFARIRSIKSRQMNAFTITSDDGKVHVMGPMDGWHDFINRVQAANPGVTLDGV